MNDALQPGSIVPKTSATRKFPTGHQIAERATGSRAGLCCERLPRQIRNPQSSSCYPEITVANIYRVFFALACAWTAIAQPSGVLGVLSEELDRNFRGLKEKADPAPYYMSYSVTEQDYTVISASFGAITSNNHTRTAN